MRIPIGLLIGVGWVGVGCQNLPPLPEPAPPPEAPEPLIRPLDGVIGRVASVQTRLQFVVLDYALNTLPEVDARLDVLRGEKVVAELRVTGPTRGSTIVADIVSGEPQAGDMTRPQVASGTP